MDRHNDTWLLMFVSMILTFLRHSNVFYVYIFVIIIAVVITIIVIIVLVINIHERFIIAINIVITIGIIIIIVTVIIVIATVIVMTSSPLFTCVTCCFCILRKVGLEWRCSHCVFYTCAVCSVQVLTSPSQQRHFPTVTCLS